MLNMPYPTQNQSITLFFELYAILYGDTILYKWNTVKQEVVSAKMCRFFNPNTSQTQAKKKEKEKFNPSKE